MLDDAVIVIMVVSFICSYPLIISFVNLDQSGSFVWKIVALVAGLLILWSVANSTWVDRHLSNIISKVLKKQTQIQVQDFAKQLHLAGDYQVNELQVRKTDWLAHKTETFKNDCKGIILCRLATWLN